MYGEGLSFPIGEHQEDTAAEDNVARVEVRLRIEAQLRVNQVVEEEPTAEEYRTLWNEVEKKALSTHRRAVGLIPREALQAEARRRVKIGASSYLERLEREGLDVRSVGEARIRNLSRLGRMAARLRLAKIWGRLQDAYDEPEKRYSGTYTILPRDIKDLPRLSKKAAELIDRATANVSGEGLGGKALLVAMCLAKPGFVNEAVVTISGGGSADIFGNIAVVEGSPSEAHELAHDMVRGWFGPAERTPYLALLYKRPHVLWLSESVAGRAKLLFLEGADRVGRVSDHADAGQWRWRYNHYKNAFKDSGGNPSFGAMVYEPESAYFLEFLFRQPDGPQKVKSLCKDPRILLNDRSLALAMERHFGSDFDSLTRSFARFMIGETPEAVLGQ